MESKTTTVKFTHVDMERLEFLKGKIGIDNVADVLRICIKEKYDKEIKKEH